MSDDLVQIEIDGKAMPARKGAMIIEVADAAGIRIPRFCYHPKLSIAANCRMCLVEVEKAPKALPACATPVMDGMKVLTHSAKAIAGQKATMEFLLINHPLDCPICDQGGECELQDVSLGYGSGVSRFSERKRVVMDQDIGPLVATEMTRCIHCTRCVRFGDEIAGLRELGAIGRGEFLEIGTYVGHAMVSELSGNVIDLCPVGALTAKPSRFRARAWELVQHDSVSAHDSVGSNVSLHTLRNEVIRTVPRDNEAVNEAWISDRDRYSYVGLKAQDRLTTPLVRGNEGLREAEWEQALEATVEGVRAVIAEHGVDSVGVLVSPNATAEEMFLLQKWARDLGIVNIDHRLRQTDTSGQDVAPPLPWLGQSLVDLESLDAALLVGSNIRMEQPLAGHRIRKAALRGAQVSFINSRRHEFLFPVSHHLLVAPQQMVRSVAELAAAVAELRGVTLPEWLEDAAGLQPGEQQQALARTLIDAEHGAVLMGSQSMVHPGYSVLCRLAAWIAAQTQCRLGYLPEAANSAGGWLAGAVPHRLPGARPCNRTGLAASAMVEKACRAWILFGVEPELDCAVPGAALSAVRQADFVVSLTSWASPVARDYSSVMLPIAAAGETAGTWINLEGRWQTVRGAVTPPGEARPGWKVLRVLGNLFDLQEFDYMSADQVLDELYETCREIEPDNRMESSARVAVGDDVAGLFRGGDVPIYAVDAMVRRSGPLQATPLAAVADARVNARTLDNSGCVAGTEVIVRQNGVQVVLPLVLDDTVPDDCVWIPAGVAGTEALGPLVGPVELATGR